jgi:hypothetical protein
VHKTWSLIHGSGSGNNYDTKEKHEKEELKMKEEAHKQRCNEI